MLGAPCQLVMHRRPNKEICAHQAGPSPSGTPHRRPIRRSAKTVWQLAYAGSVGSQVLVGLPAVKRLIEDPRIAGRAAVWPLQTGLRTPNAPVVIAEVYPSLLRKEIGDQVRAGEILDCAQVRVNAEAFAWLDAEGGLPPLFNCASGLTHEQRRLVETEEAWILGLGHEEALRAALPSL